MGLEPLWPWGALRRPYAEFSMDLAFIALGVFIFVAFGVYAALLKRV